MNPWALSQKPPEKLSSLSHEDLWLRCYPASGLRPRPEVIRMKS